MRRSFVQINGQLYAKTGNNSAIIDGEIWRCIAGKWERTDAPPSPGLTIIPDIKPYRSVIDGTEITSRSRHREHLREHGCIEVGNERVRPGPLPEPALQGLRDELAARYNS